MWPCLFFLIACLVFVFLRARCCLTAASVLPPSKSASHRRTLMGRPGNLINPRWVACLQACHPQVKVRRIDNNALCRISWARGLIRIEERKETCCWEDYRNKQVSGQTPFKSNKQVSGQTHFKSNKFQYKHISVQIGSDPFSLKQTNPHHTNEVPTN